MKIAEVTDMLRRRLDQIEALKLRYSQQTDRGSTVAIRHEAYTRLGQLAAVEREITLTLETIEYADNWDRATCPYRHAPTSEKN